MCLFHGLNLIPYNGINYGVMSVLYKIFGEFAMVFLLFFGQKVRNKCFLRNNYGVDTI